MYDGIHEFSRSEGVFFAMLFVLVREVPEIWTALEDSFKCSGAEVTCFDLSCNDLLLN